MFYVIDSRTPEQKAASDKLDRDMMKFIGKCLKKFLKLCRFALFLASFILANVFLINALVWGMEEAELEGMQAGDFINPIKRIWHKIMS